MLECDINPHILSGCKNNKSGKALKPIWIQFQLFSRLAIEFFVTSLSLILTIKMSELCVRNFIIIILSKKHSKFFNHKIEHKFFLVEIVGGNRNDRKLKEQEYKTFTSIQKMDRQITSWNWKTVFCYFPFSPSTFPSLLSLCCKKNNKVFVFFLPRIHRYLDVVSKESWLVVQNHNHNRVFAQHRVKVQQAIRYQVTGPIHPTFQFAVLKMKLQVFILIQVS